tara:strand:+ start:58 stop:987 length:930 start_codon:yes stop_codon:yes gene_type:complete
MVTNLKSLCTVVLPTFFPGDEIFNNLESIPSELQVLVIDNSYDNRLEEKLKNYKQCVYFNIGDVGLSKTFNFALNKIQTPYALITQPDVTLRENCIQNLLVGFNKYKDAGFVVPIVYDNGTYSKYDFYDFKYSKKKRIIKDNKNKNKNNLIPSGNFCVDAVNSTTIMFKTDTLKNIGGWDENIYAYFEDMDISLRLVLKKYSIIKIANAIVDHKGWSSHYNSINDTMNITRIWHFTWGGMYFKNKYCRKSDVIYELVRNILKLLLKNLFHILTFNYRKLKINKVKLSAYYSFIMKKGSYFRVKHNVKKN